MIECPRSPNKRHVMEYDQFAEQFMCKYCDRVGAW